MASSPAPRGATTSCCAEFADLARSSRRAFLGGAVAAGVATAFGSAVVQPAAVAASGRARGVVVVLSLRGAADGLSLVVPHGDPVYAQARPRLAVPTESLLAADPFFGLHPALAPLLPLWQQGKVAAVHAAGLPARNRSHFSAMEELEDAAPGATSRTGWLNRLVGAQSLGTPLQAMHLGGSSPASLYGPAPHLTTRTVADVGIAGADQWDVGGGRVRSLHTLWDGRQTHLARSMRATFAAVGEFAPVKASEKTPQNGVTYPAHDLGRALSEVARIVRSDVGVEVVTVDHGDWDMHTGVGTVAGGAMKTNAGQLADALAAFFADLGTLGEQVTVVCLSEFGRRVRENANGGLDHGYGTVMLLLGAGVRGGYHGSWPGLQDGADSDLLVTTDYRSVLAEVVSSRFGASIPTVFPGFTPTRVGAMLGR
ncbi:DUF1501 domain-containing protein [Nocardioides solisilvae]|uniref:DUF1501 domain-containing protein n=1 Tax=Nocardioides solisilvae TaxID=1542435 RepID=UPI000D745DA5|nr:DUF1501 domain-containing protein [Nocardioides solisilvae]